MAQRTKAQRSASAKKAARTRKRNAAAKKSKRTGAARKRKGSKGKKRGGVKRSEEHTSELQSRRNLVCRLLLDKKKEQIEQS